MLAGAMLIAPIAGAAEDDFRIESKQGSVESVDYAANKMVVGGVVLRRRPRRQRSSWAAATARSR